MKKGLLYTSTCAIFITAAISGCSMTGEAPEPTIAPVEKPAVSQEVLSDYALLPGYSLYQSADNSYSIQIPEGSSINDADPFNVTVSIENDFGAVDNLNIKMVENADVIDSEAKLMEMLKDDNSIDITGFFILKKEGEYEGYKYTFTATNDPNFKSIKSVYFSDDRSAFIITASSPNGNDDINMTNLNTVVDTFINHK